MPKIGPTFTDELRQAGVQDFRFSWTRETGQIDYHPDVPDDERKKVEAVLKAHDGPLSEARHLALEAIRAEAAKRIAEMFLQPPGSLDLVFAELNTLAKAVGIVEKGAGNETFAERTDLEVLKGVWGRIQGIREAGRGAKAALLGAKSVEEVQAVNVEWPASASPESPGRGAKAALLGAKSVEEVQAVNVEWPASASPESPPL